MPWVTWLSLVQLTEPDLPITALPADQVQTFCSSRFFMFGFFSGYGLFSSFHRSLDEIGIFLQQITAVLDHLLDPDFRFLGHLVQFAAGLIHHVMQFLAIYGPDRKAVNRAKPPPSAALITEQFADGF